MENLTEQNIPQPTTPGNTRYKGLFIVMAFLSLILLGGITAFVIRGRTGESSQKPVAVQPTVLIALDGLGRYKYRCV